MSYRAGFIGMVGMPNAGKSTLVNALLGEKVGIVTAKPQTTRQKVIGISNTDSAQALFVDAPGWVKSEAGLNKFLQDELSEVIKESDALMAVLNIDQKNFEDLQKVIQACVESRKPWVAVITKSDLAHENRTLILKQTLQDYNVPVVITSVRKERGGVREKILPLVESMLPESAGPLYPDDIYTTQTSRQLAEERIREQCFETLHQEVPYGIAVKVNKFVEDDGPTLKIYADIWIAKENHKQMVIGSGGKTIRHIGVKSREILEKIFDRKVHLELHAKVRKNWQREKGRMQELGYVHSN